MPHRSARPIAHGLMAALLALSLGCQPAAVPVSPAAKAGASLTLTPGGLAAARERLAGAGIDDYTLSLIGARKRRKAAAAPALPAPGGRTLQAYGDAPSAAWTGGVALSALGCAGTDLATNGVAVRQISSNLPTRLFVVTRQGKFLDLDPAAPATGGIVTDLAETFTKTFVSLSGNGKVAFLVSDAGNAYAIDLENVVSGAHPIKVQPLATPCVAAAAFIDPLASDTHDNTTTAYVVANNGQAFRLAFGAADFGAAGFAATGVGVATAITTAVTGPELVKSSCVALGGVIYVGDRRGYMNKLDTGSNTLTSWRTNPAWPIETAPALDVDDDLAVTDVFIPCGAQLFWIKPGTGAVYPGHYAVVENKGATAYSGKITSASFGTYVNLSNTNIKPDGSTYRVSTLFKHPVSDAVVLPGQTTAIDPDRLTHSEFVTGQPPGIEAYIGPAGRTYGDFTQWTSFGNPPVPGTPNGGSIAPPVPDGTALAAARLQGPVGIEVMDDGTTYPADDGSLFIGDSDHCQVLFRPATATSGQKWASAGPLAAALDPGKLYVFSGTMNPDNVWNAGDIGNGVGGAIKDLPARLSSAVARGTPINLIFGMAIGNLGLYIGQLNKNTSGSYKNGAVLFVPRVGVTAAYGMTGLVAGRQYVLTTACNPQGLCVDRADPLKDTLYMASFDWGGASNQNTIMKMDSTSSADATVFQSGLSRPVDVCLDDQGNLFTAESNGSRVSMFWDTRGLGVANTRTWGVAGPVANTRYTVASGLNQPQTVTFALNDPQVPDGCLYIGNTGNHTIKRIDQGGAQGSAAGTGSAGDIGDGGPATSARLNFPHRAKGDGKGVTYIADRFNNRIRILRSPPDAGVAIGYVRFNASAFQNRAIYGATLTLTSMTSAGTLGAPTVAVADPYLAGGTTLWTHTNLVPTKAPALDLVNGVASPASTTWTYNVDSTHAYYLPPNAIPTGATGEGATVRLAMQSPTDSNLYYYPTGIGLPSGSKKSPEFYSHTTATTAKRPSLDVTSGSVQIKRSILSPPAIEYDGAKKYVYITNANALFRYDVTTPAAFTAGVDMTLSATGRGFSNGTLYTPDTAFQPNPTPPVVGENGRVHILDIRAVSASSYNYGLTAFNGISATPDMWLGQTKSIATGVTSSFADNAGIYMASGGYYIDETYFGLGNNKLYRVVLTP